jgi:signal transduction histidine kinase
LDNDGVSQASALVGRVVGATRHVTGRAVLRVVAREEWPPVAAGALALGALAEVLAAGDAPQRNDAVALLLALPSTAPVAVVRTHLAAAAVTVTATTGLMLLSRQPPFVCAVLAQLAVLYLVGRHRNRRWTALAVLPFVAYAVAGSFDDRLKAPVVLLLVLAAGAAALGSARQARAEAIERRLSSQAVADTLLEHAARGERARIARELHDVVAHHISMIAVQAETARLTTPGMPDEGAKRLVAIGDTARAALTEMRRLLGVLREDAGTETTRKPQPGLQQLNELLDEARESAGSSARLIVHGQVAPLDPGVELAAYRIVQEALTNTRRHAPGAAVDVELDYAESELRIRVRDNGPGPPEHVREGAHGLLGMRERAASVGGRLRVGVGPGSGFLVEAALPTGEADE